jgi:hypothetical protein
MFPPANTTHIDLEKKRAIFWDMALYPYRSLPMFRRNVLPPVSWSKNNTLKQAATDEPLTLKMLEVRSS